MARPINNELHALRRQEILSAAATIFRAKGFHLSRTEDICSEANLSAGTIFRYFKDKQAIIDAIITIEIENSREELSQIATKAGMQWLASLNEAGLKQLLAPQGFQLGSISWIELSRTPEGKAQLLKVEVATREALVEALNKGQQAGWMRQSLNTKGAAKILLSIIISLQFDSDLALPIDYPATAAALADLVASWILN